MGAWGDGLFGNDTAAELVVALVNGRLPADRLGLFAHAVAIPYLGMARPASSYDPRNRRRMEAFRPAASLSSSPAEASRRPPESRRAVMAGGRGLARMEATRRSTPATEEHA